MLRTNQSFPATVKSARTCDRPRDYCRNSNFCLVCLGGQTIFPEPTRLVRLFPWQRLEHMLFCVFSDRFMQGQVLPKRDRCATHDRNSHICTPIGNSYIAWICRGLVYVLPGNDHRFDPLPQRAEMRTTIPGKSPEPSIKGNCIKVSFERGCKCYPLGRMSIRYLTPFLFHSQPLNPAGEGRTIQLTAGNRQHGANIPQVLF